MAVEIDWQAAAERHMERIGHLERELAVVRRLLACATYDQPPGWRDDATMYLSLCPQDEYAA